MSIMSFECFELLGEILGVDSNDEDEIRDQLYDRFGMDEFQFSELMEKLLPLVDVGKSPLSKELFRGFSKKIGDDGTRLWLLKAKV